MQRSSVRDFPPHTTLLVTGVGSEGASGRGGAMVCLCPPPLLTPLELYVYITLRNNYLKKNYIPINYLVDNFNKLTQMAVIK